MLYAQASNPITSSLPSKILSFLKNYVRYQKTSPLPYKMCAGHPIFESRPDFGPLKKGVGQVKISDFSVAVFGNAPVPHSHDIQPLQFCAPEVFLGAGWSYSADIWNLGLVLWELLAETAIFDGKSRGSDEYSQAAHLAQMIRLLGPPPSRFLEKADKALCSMFFSDEGIFGFPDLMPSEDFNLSNLTPSLHDEDKQLFRDYAKRMLQWDPEHRATARELYSDP